MIIYRKKYERKKYRSGWILFVEVIIVNII